MSELSLAIWRAALRRTLVNLSFPRQPAASPDSDRALVPPVAADLGILRLIADLHSGNDPRVTQVLIKDVLQALDDAEALTALRKSGGLVSDAKNL